MTLSDAERLQRELFLRAAFPGLSGTPQARLVEALQSRQLVPGEVLFRTGESADLVYLLVDGSLAMESELNAAWVYGPGSALGVFDAILDRTRARTCHALLPSTLWQLGAALWREVLDDDPEAARSAVLRFAQSFAGCSAPLDSETSQPSTRGYSSSRSDLSLYERIVALRAAPLFARAGLEAIGALAELAAEVRFEVGETLFGMGQAPEQVQIIVAGSVELSRLPDFTCRHGMGELIGGPAALCRGLRESSVVALEPCIVLNIAEQDYFDRAEEHPRLSHGTLAYLVGEMERLNHVLPPQDRDSFARNVG